MHRRLVEFLLLLFLAFIGVNRPVLPFNASAADLIFIPLAVSIVALAGFRWTWRRSDSAVAIYLLAALPAIAVSADQRASAIELIREVYLAAIYIVIAIAAREGFARTIGKGLALGGAMLSIIGLIFVVGQLSGQVWPAPLMGEFMQLPYLGETLRLRAMTASEAMFACLLTAAAPFAIAMCTSDRVRTWCAASIAMLFAVAWTFSHAIAGFAVAVLMSAWPSLAALPRLRRAAIAGVVLIVLALNFAATFSIESVTLDGSSYADASTYHYAVDRGVAQIGGATIAYNVMSYARIKQVAWRSFLAHPIAGIGLDQFHSATRQAFDAGALTAAYREIDPHSTLVGRLAETGIIGGIALVVLWLAWVGLVREVSASPIGYAAGAALAGLIVSSLNADIMNFRFLWVIAGLMRGLQEPKVTSSGRGESDTAGAR